MKIRAIAPWFGAKRMMADEIVAELGDHQAYWEPFCGSMAVLLAKPACRMETVNDLHGDLVNLARTIQDEKDGAWLYRQLRRRLLSSELFEDSATVIRDRSFEPTRERACDYFITSWFGRNGVSGTTSYNQGFCVRYTNNGGHGATRLLNATLSIPAWRERMRRVTILSHDGIELCKRIEDAKGTVIYCDPPYLKKKSKYTHDFTLDDHVRLSEALQRFKKTRVVVSYYDDLQLDALYPDWTKLDKSRPKQLANQSRRDKTDGPVNAPEVLLINGPSMIEASAMAITTGSLF